MSACPIRELPPIGLLGLLEVVGAALLLVALQRGPVSVAVVLASLYPVTTVLLAAAVLRERLTRPQLAGVASGADRRRARLDRLTAG